MAMPAALQTLPTPCLLVERARLLRNAARMQVRAERLGVALRPHLKTVKSAAIARLVVPSGKATVSTLREAEYFSKQGLTDLVWARCVAPSNVSRAASLVDAGVDLKLLTDGVEGARAIASARTPLSALIEIDSGEGRTGLPADGQELMGVADILGERLVGVLTHAGHSYACRSVEEVQRVAEQERAAAVHAATRLRRAGFSCPIVSVGSTPTATHCRDMSGATEMRPGVYLFGDLYQVAIGSCLLDDVALSVLATVISRRGDRAVIDAGALALSKDRSTAKTPHDAGYGLVADVHGNPLSGAVVAEVHQEHGMIVDAPPQLVVGSRVRIWPNHACLTAAAHSAYYVLDSGLSVVDRWERCNGW